MWDEGTTKGEVVYVPDDVQITKVLGPDGKPYAIRREKFKLGFALPQRYDKN
jgi:hypothetical protein